jgi:hypothetical protein
MLMLLAVPALQGAQNKSQPKRASPASTIPSNWGTYVDRINGFSIRFPPGSVIGVSKGDGGGVDVDIVPLPGTAGWGGLGVHVHMIPNPQGLTAEEVYQADLAEIDKQQEKEPDRGYPGSSNTFSQRKVSIGGQPGHEREYLFANGYREHEVTLAWDKLAYQIGYTVSSMDMTDKQRAENPQRIKLLEMMISTIRQVK